MQQKKDGMKKCKRGSQRVREKVREFVKKRNPKRSLKYIQQFGIKILFFV